MIVEEKPSIVPEETLKVLEDILMKENLELSFFLQAVFIRKNQSNDNLLYQTSC